MDVGEAPGLWQKISIKVTRKNLPAMPRLLGAWRMREVRRIQISVLSAASEDLLKEAVVHPGLRQITFSYSDLSSVSPRLLAKLVNGLEDVRISKSILTKQQVEVILVGLTGKTKLRRLSILNVDLSSVDPYLLASAVGRLELVQLPKEKRNMTDEQSEAIYTAVASGATQIKSLVVGMTPLEPEVVARAINNLEYWNASLGRGTAEAILTQSLVKTSLKKMILRIRGPIKVDQHFVTEARKVIPDLVVRHIDIWGAQHV